jgi:hypothetical protein
MVIYLTYDEDLDIDRTISREIAIWIRNDSDSDSTHGELYKLLS